MKIETKFAAPEPLEARIKRAMAELEQRPASQRFQTLVELGHLTQAQADAAIAKLPHPQKPLKSNFKTVKNRRLGSR
jgi:hypothetical protein